MKKIVHTFYLNKTLQTHHYIPVPLRERNWVAPKTRLISRIPTTKSARTLAAATVAATTIWKSGRKCEYENSELGHLDAPTSSALSMAVWH